MGYSTESGRLALRPSTGYYSLSHVSYRTCEEHIGSLSWELTLGDRWMGSEADHFPVCDGQRRLELSRTRTRSPQQISYSNASPTITS